MKVRDLIVALRAAGARPVRQRGSHQTWRFPDGETFLVIANHQGADVAPFIEKRLRRALERRRSSVAASHPARRELLSP